MTATKLNEIISCDSVHKTKGVFVAKRTFFYKHGMNHALYAQKIFDQLTEAGLKFRILDHSEHWNAWPKDSWFEVRFNIN